LSWWARRATVISIFHDQAPEIAFLRRTSVFTIVLFVGSPPSDFVPSIVVSGVQQRRFQACFRFPQACPCPHCNPPGAATGFRFILQLLELTAHAVDEAAVNTDTTNDPSTIVSESELENALPQSFAAQGALLG
jgi:hypothetical protein